MEQVKEFSLTKTLLLHDKLTYNNVLLQVENGRIHYTCWGDFSRVCSRGYTKVGMCNNRLHTCLLALQQVPYWTLFAMSNSNANKIKLTWRVYFTNNWTQGMVFKLVSPEAYMWAYPKGNHFFRLQFYERLGISRVEVYERVGKNLSMFRYLKLLFCLKKYEQNQLMAKCSQYNLYNKPQRNTIRQSCSYPSWPRGYGSLIPNPCSYNNIYSPLSGFQSYCCQLIHFCCGPNTCSHYTKQWHRTYLIHDAPLSRSAQCALTLLHKSSRTHRSC